MLRGLCEELLLRSSLSCHHTLEGVVFEVEDVRELKAAVDLVVLKRVKVENDPLQVHNQHIGRLSDELSLFNIDLLLAVFALEVIDDRALDHLLKAGLEALAVFDLHTQVVVALEKVPDVSARRADDLRANLSSKYTFEQILLACWLQKILQSCKEEVQELLGILLESCVSWVSFKVFVSETEAERIESLPLREFKICKHDLKLSE